MRITTIAWTLLAATLAVSAATPATAADGVAFEVVITKPKPGVSLAALLQADKTMEQQFVSKQPGYINREVAGRRTARCLPWSAGKRWRRPMPRQARSCTTPLHWRGWACPMPACLRIISSNSGKRRARGGGHSVCRHARSCLSRCTP